MLLRSYTEILLASKIVLGDSDRCTLFELVGLALVFELKVIAPARKVRLMVARESFHCRKLNKA